MMPATRVVAPPTGDGHSRPLARAAATLRLCSSSVVANACFPFASAMT